MSILGSIIYIYLICIFIYMHIYIYNIICFSPLSELRASPRIEIARDLARRDAMVGPFVDLHG